MAGCVDRESEKSPVPEPLKTNASQSETRSHDRYSRSSTMVTALKHSHMIEVDLFFSDESLSCLTWNTGTCNALI